MTPTLSILMAYYDRAFQLAQTLESYGHHYGEQGLGELELLIAVDGANVSDAEVQHSDVNRVLGPWRRRFGHIRTYQWPDRRATFRNPGKLYNALAMQAESPRLFLTNPENFHAEPVFPHVLAHLAAGRYLVYACRASERHGLTFADYESDPFCLDTDYWNQHTVTNNPLLHFASAILRDEWDRIGGFEPAYDQGLAFEDNDLVEKILLDGMTIHAFDTPYVVHQWHSRDGQRDAAGANPPEWWTNRDLFQRRWGHLPRVFAGARVSETI